MVQLEVAQDVEPGRRLKGLEQLDRLASGKEFLGSATLPMVKSAATVDSPVPNYACKVQAYGRFPEENKSMCFSNTFRLLMSSKKSCGSVFSFIIFPQDMKKVGAIAIHVRRSRWVSQIGLDGEFHEPTD